MKNFLSRALTALIAVPLLMASLYLAPWWAWGAIAAVALVITSLEYFALTHRDDPLGRYVGIALNFAVFAALLYTDFGRTHAWLALGVVLASTPVAMLYTLARPGPMETALTRMASMALAPMYLGAMIAAIAGLRRVGTDHQGAGLVVLTFFVSWFGDTGGYVFGKTLKGPKLYPAVSPNKTWAGALGGLAFSGLGAVAAHFVYLKELPLATGLLWSVLAGAFGQAGDFCESLLKRSVGVKDSGGILPGHGGFLDRLDAMMFVALALYAALRSGWLTLGG